MGKRVIIFMIIFMLNLHQIFATTAFCGGGRFKPSTSCWKYCPNKAETTWCYISKYSDAIEGDEPTSCANDKNICNPKWKCVSPCVSNLGKFDFLDLFGL